MAEYGRMDPFSFAGSKDVHHPVSIRIMNLEGEEPPFKFSTLLERPDLRHVGSNIRCAMLMISKPSLRQAN
jgi:phosphatidylinositol 3-kinase